MLIVGTLHKLGKLFPNSL